MARLSCPCLASPRVHEKNDCLSGIPTEPQKLPEGCRKELWKNFKQFLRSCLKFFLRTFEIGFRAGFCRFLRRIAALFYDKNGGNMPE